MATDMFTVVAETMTAQTNEANDLVTKIQSASSENKGLVHEIREDQETNDPVILNYRKKMEAANAEILQWQAETDEHIRTNVLPKPDENFDVEAAKVQYGELKKVINAARTFVSKMPGYSDEVLANVPGLKTLRGGTTSGNATGTKRPRLQSITVSEAGKDNWRRVYDTVKNEKDGTEKEIQTFTLLAKALSTKDHTVKGSDLQSAAFEAAGTNDLSTKAGEVVEFAFNNGETNYMVRVIPVDRDAAE